MRGAFETTAEGAVVAREEFEIKDAAKGKTLAASGSEKGKRDRKWTLEARLSPGGAFESVDLQVTPAPPPTEVTTTVLRMYGGRAFGTTIPPGGVPEKFETAFEAAGALRGFSTALDGLSLGRLPFKVGHGRRLFVVILDTAELRPAVRDMLVLCRARSREKTPEGEQWCSTVDLRAADEPGRTHTTLVIAKSGLVLRLERPGRIPALRTDLVDFRA